MYREYRDNGKLCPLMGGRPCTGNDCAMAVYSVVGELWRCGLPVVGTKEGGNVIGTERLEVRNMGDGKELSEMVRRMMSDESTTDAQRFAALEQLSKEDE